MHYGVNCYNVNYNAIENKTCVSILSTTSFFQTFLILTEIEQDKIKECILVIM
jgi:hypothetical protein